MGNSSNGPTIAPGNGSGNNTSGNSTGNVGPAPENSNKQKDDEAPLDEEEESVIEVDVGIIFKLFFKLNK